MEAVANWNQGSLSPRTSGKRVLVIRNRKNLYDLINQRYSLLTYPHKVDISLAFPGLNPNQRSHYEQLLTKAYSKCGCFMGKVFGFVFWGYSTAIVLWLNFYEQLGWYLIPAWLLTFLLIVATGKAVGLAQTRSNLRQIISEI